VVRALGEEVGSSIEFATSARPAIRNWPAGLTEREVQVLRLLAKGRNRREIAKDLVVSEGTIRSHLEHIYAKIGVSTQIAAVLFALEHELVD
jgi:DNA-binding NarL/FixJ family response regulator